MTTSRVSISMGVVFGLVSFLMMPSAATAADLGQYGGGSVKDYAPAPAAPSRALYLKGTIGLANTDTDQIWTNGHGTDGYQSGNFTVIDKNITSSTVYGFGVGFEANRWLRFDVTADYRGKALFTGLDRYQIGATCTAGVNCGTNEYQADITTWTGLFNAYIDLGTFRGVTPYVGAGVGFANHHVEGFRDVNVPTGGYAYGDKSHNDTNFAWALYGGMSYDVTDKLTLDFAYRYIDMGDTETGRATAFDGSDSYQGLQIRDITSQDFLVSARYRLDRHEPVYPVAMK